MLKNRINIQFEKLKKNNDSALVPYLTAGFPDRETFVDLSLKILDNGADMLEIGVPFSDPLADGPTIQKTNFQAIQNGITLSECINLLRLIRKSNTESPAIFMGYFNPFLAYGIDDFLLQSSQVGLDGLIVPDLPISESKQISEKCFNSGIHLIPLLAPTSTEETIQKACEQAKGFIYCVSLTGVTGARKNLSLGVETLVKKIKAYTDIPVLVGFGVSKREDVLNISKFSDGAVVGSAFLDSIQNSDQNKKVKAGVDFVKKLAI